MNLTIEQLAEILAGLAKSQQAIIDAIDSENAGWKNTHLIPKLTTASNMRLAVPRLIDVPSRILLRSQTRVTMDVETITRLLHAAVSGEPVPAVPPAKPAVSIPADYVAPAAAATAGAVAGAAAVAATASTAAPPPSAGDLDSFFDT